MMNNSKSLLPVRTWMFTHLRSSHLEFILKNRKAKRGSILSKMLVNRDTNKKWHLNFMEMAPRSKSVFEKIHRPKKRQNVLDSILVKNITDVLSTGDIAPNVFGLGVEINGVKISSCFKTLHVYWEIPPTSYDRHEEIAIELNTWAPRLRAELISRNVIGRVPHIYFIRDITNDRVARFENAMKDIDLGPENERSIIPDDSFTKEILKFKTAKEEIKRTENVADSKAKNLSKSSTNLPQRPTNMKSDVFGLKYDDLMSKVLSSKTKEKSPQNTAVISSEFFPSSELFDKIPGTPLQADIERKKFMKQFDIEKKIARNKKPKFKITKKDFILDGDYEDDYCEDEDSNFVKDYIEEDVPEKF